MKKVHRVIIQGIYYGNNRVMPSLNDYLHECGRHPQIGAKMKRDYMMVASKAIRGQLGRLQIKSPVYIRYHFYEADMRRDPSNIAAFFIKVFEDSLQQCGVLKDDGWVWMKGYSQDFAVDKDNPRVEVEIEVCGDVFNGEIGG